MAMNSALVDASDRKQPVMRLVIITTPGFLMPRVVMHWCAASITTATPFGFKTPVLMLPLSAITHERSIHAK